MTDGLTDGRKDRRTDDEPTFTQNEPHQFVTLKGLVWTCLMVSATVHGLVSTGLVGSVMVNGLGKSCYGIYQSGPGFTMSPKVKEDLS